MGIAGILRLPGSEHPTVVHRTVSAADFPDEEAPLLEKSQTRSDDVSFQKDLGDDKRRPKVPALSLPSSSQPPEVATTHNSSGKEGIFFTDKGPVHLVLKGSTGSNA